ncbi:sigma-70 family RNA polymerase sigma factor [Lyngbya aestuarii]|uniref:sigma-70 family RNA polymerase sigma factor n=1 Tax=Lyngbya aestuarii TaxID=118322 RepID=UPI00403D5858
MSALHETLKQLVADACTHPPRSVARQQCIQEIYRLVVNSGKIWKENTPYYSDAFQETWEYCCQHLEDYNPKISAVTTWIDTRLKWTLKKWRDRQNQEQQRQANPIASDEDTPRHPLDNLASNPGASQAMQIWQATVTWVQQDPEGKLQQTCFRKRPEINAQALFLKRFPSETPWQEIAQEFELTPAQAKDLPKFYNRNCLPLLREFGVVQGYI